MFQEGDIIKETTTASYDEDYILSLLGKRSAPDYPDEEMEKTGSQLLSKIYIEEHNSTIKGIDHVRNFALCVKSNVVVFCSKTLIKDILTKISL